MNNRYAFFASCAAGLERLTASEIAEFSNGEVAETVGGVSWQGNLESAYRACLWSRFASRILLCLNSFSIKDEEDLYKACSKVNWIDFIDATKTFAVSSSFGANPALSHSHFASLRVKDGIVDSFRSLGLERPNVAKQRPDLQFHLYLRENQATLYLDLSGESLHRRGYRQSSGIAPLKESLAAAIVALSGWDKEVSPKWAFVDPMCGSGTLLIEAALMYSDSAPGLSRKYFGFTKWLGHDESLWSTLVDEAVAREEKGLERKWPRLIGYDADPEMIAVARNNLKNSGLEDRIEIKCQEFSHLQPPANQGYLVSNLPYGQRLSEKNRVKYLYGSVGRKLVEKFQGWQGALFVSEPDLADTLGLAVVNSHRLYNGPLSCRLFTGPVALSRQESGERLEVKAEQEIIEAVDFSNRVRKNEKKIRSWAKKNKISCFRLYDRDLPEYNLTIDIYDRWILVQEYAPPASVDKDLSDSRFTAALRVVRELFQVRRERVFIKRRQRQKGKTQYQKKTGKIRYHEVREGECFFLVNFTSYLDVGLFLDHRPIRTKIAGMARGKRFLNLYGYTGAATVHAAKGGAASTTTVDVSANYLEWAHNNLALNGLSSRNNKLVEEDCLTWVKGAKEKFDLVFIDPPTFSNNKKKKRIFEIQKDHYELLLHTFELLDSSGVLFFSTNFRSFRLDQRLFQRYDVVDISRETIPFDFRRNSKIHRCWQMKKKENL